MVVSGIAAVSFMVTDMKESRRFYEECLGFQKLFELKDDDGEDWLIYFKIADRQYLKLFYHGDRKRVIFFPTEEKELAKLTPAHFDEMNWQISTHFCLEVENIQEVCGRLAEYGYEVTNPPAIGKDLNYETFVQDPDGNLIELMQFEKDNLELRKYDHTEIFQ